MPRFAATLLALPLFAGCAAPPYVALGPNAPPDPLQQQLALDAALGDGAPKPGNRVVILRDGGETFPAMFAAIAAARDHINLEYFIFQDVHSGGETLGGLLVRKLGEGVAVNVIMDGYGSFRTDPAFLDRLRRAGARILVFHPLDLASVLKLNNPNDRDHRKIMVIDGRVAFVGGVNLDRAYENPHPPPGAASADPKLAYWRDTDARIEGPAVADLQRLFLDTWSREHGPALPERACFPPLAPGGPAVVRIIGSAPGEDRPLYYVAFLTALHAAHESIDLSTGFFVPTHEEREELDRAARRGVAVRLVLPSVSTSPMSLAAGHAAYDDLLEAGARIAEVQGMVLHSKLAVIDGVWTVVGSSNLDRRSVVFNNEVDAVIIGRATAATARDVLAQDAAGAAPVTLAAWRHRPAAEREAEIWARIWQWLL
jgi:cardiolipin synthase